MPAQDNRAAAVEAQAPAAAGEGVPVGRRAHTGRQGQGTTAWAARLEPAVVGITGLTTEAPDGAAAHGRPHHRRACQPTPLNAVVGRPWHTRDDGPGGTTVCLTTAPVDTPLPPWDEDDDRRRIEPGGIHDSQPPWSVKQPPQTPARAVRVHVLCTRLMCALATASRLPCEPVAAGAAPSGGQRWRRPRLEQTRDLGSLCAEDGDGIGPIAEYSRWLGVTLHDVPPGLGTRRDLRAKYGLAAHG